MLQTLFIIRKSEPIMHLFSSEYQIQQYSLTISMQDYNAWATPGVFQQSYPAIAYAGVLVGMIYFGVYIMLSNHFVFKPKIKKIIDKFSPADQKIAYRIMFELLIDLINNLSAVGLSFSATFISSSHNAISTFVISDSIWMGLLSAVLLYRVKDEIKVIFSFSSIKLILKNSVCLILIYIVLIIHYAFDLYLITLPIILVILYISNVVSNFYFEQIEKYLRKIIFLEEEEEVISLEFLKEKSIYPDPQFLAKNFPVTEKQFIEKGKDLAAMRKEMKLKSKAMVYQKLHQIHLKVLISFGKYKENEKNKAKYYFGKINNTLRDKNYQTKETTNIVKRQKSMSINQQTMNFLNVEAQTLNQGISPKLYYIFPIKIFQFSQVISFIMSIILNLGYGIFLDISLQILLKLQIGSVFTFLSGFFILPLLPNVKVKQFYNSLSLSSNFKYGFIGFVLLINQLQTMSYIITWSSLTTLYLNYTIQIIFFVYCFIVILVVQWQEYKLVSLCFILVSFFQAYVFYNNASSFY